MYRSYSKGYMLFLLFLHHKIHSLGKTISKKLVWASAVCILARKPASVVWSRTSVSSASAPEAAAPWVSSNDRSRRLSLIENNSIFLGTVYPYGATEALARTVARVGPSVFPRHARFLHVEIFSRWDTQTLAFCLGFYRLPHLARASCSECKFHTSGFYTCTGWRHSMRALLTVLRQFNTHMKVGCLGLPMGVCCTAHASAQEMPD